MIGHVSSFQWCFHLFFANHSHYNNSREKLSAYSVIFSQDLGITGKDLVRLQKQTHFCTCNYFFSTKVMQLEYVSEMHECVRQEGTEVLGNPF